MIINFKTYNELFNYWNNTKLNPNEKAELYVNNKWVITLYGV